MGSHLLPFKGRGRSMECNLNLLFHEDNVFIMDNHLLRAGAGFMAAPQFPFPATPPLILPPG